MSYILDALRRAEAERGRGGVPGLHSQTVPVHGAAPAAARPLVAHPAVLLGGALALAAVAAGGTWWAMQRPGGAPAVQVAAAPAVPVAPVSPPAAPPAQPAPAVAVPAPSLPPAAAVPLAPEPAPPAAAMANPAPVAPVAPLPERRAPEKRAAEKPRERPAAEPAAQRAATAPAPGGEAPRARPPVAPAAGAAAVSPGQNPPAQGQGFATAPPPAAPVFAQADLPEAIRSQLPVLKISGATYSNNPAHRMAIVNGQVLLEGDQAGPGLVLERVEQSRTVWSFRGYRYAVGSQ